MGNEDQALTVHSKKPRRSSHHPRGKSFHKDNTRKYFSRIRCYTCDEKGNYAREFPRNKGGSDKNNEKIKQHSHTIEDDDPPRKRVKQESDEEYVLISALTGTISHGSNDWLIDSGASKHLRGFKFLKCNYQY